MNGLTRAIYAAELPFGEPPVSEVQTQTARAVELPNAPLFTATIAGNVEEHHKKAAIAKMGLCPMVNVGVKGPLVYPNALFGIYVRNCR